MSQTTTGSATAQQPSTRQAQPPQQTRHPDPRHGGIELQTVSGSSTAAAQTATTTRPSQPTATPATSSTPAHNPPTVTPTLSTPAASPPSVGASQPTGNRPAPQGNNTTSPATQRVPATTPLTQQSQPIPPNPATTPSTSTTSIPKPPPCPWLKSLTDLSPVFLIALIFAFVSAISLGANSPDWVLARLSPTSGILLLSFMSKITDWGFGGAAEKAWEMIQWGPLLRGRGGNLLSFLTLGSRFKGWVGVVGSRWAWMSRGVGGPGFWALMRIVVWVVVQFPGVILMSVVEPQLEYLPLNRTTVSGGIGVFDPSLVIQQIDGPVISNWLYSILQDPSFSILHDAVAEDCQSSTTCISVLMNGGMKTIAPFPYLHRDPQVPTYVAENVPGYQIDAWDLSNTPIRFSGRQCQLYNGDQDSVASGLYICLKDDPDGSIIASLYPCTYDCVPMEGYQNATVETSLWITKLAIYRRNSTFVANRSSGQILSVKDVSEPVRQHIPAADFRLALATFLCENGSNSTTTTNLCASTGPNAMLTDSIAHLGLTAGPDQFSPALGVLQNLFATSLYFYTPVYKKQLAVSFPASTYDLVPDLPGENYFQGSVAKPYEYVAPAPWTALAYLVSGLVLVVLCSSAIAFSSVMGTPEVSGFPGVDVVRLKVEDGNGVDQVGGIAGVFATKQGDGEVMKMAVGLTVRLDGQGQGGVSAAAVP
ncbi:hypothetical protein B0T14DRAFT_583727 [Immersiella caudata]|uniref:Uncharacterized protein n=1 Tax=Immersiella caudata TaxID=314043 RepID=A0AA40C4S1_9PEZI|nr:hypothetical protein B0T14DRAFT_583727 [Immersiella caudata]